MTTQKSLFEFEDHANLSQQKEEPTGKQLRDVGIERAVDHADRVNDAWSVGATTFFNTFIRSHNFFTTEDVVRASKDIVPAPPDARAWGGIAMRAAKSGAIIKAGYQESKNRLHHCAPKTLWKSLIFNA